MLYSALRTTKSSQTPSRLISRQMNRPKGSSPTAVMTALRAPWRAAATATFVGEPPRNFPKLVTSSSPIPVWKG